MSSNTSKLDDVVVGTEVDYNPVGSVWVPARVETVGDVTIRLRFACALRDVVHEVPIETLIKEKRIGPAGMRSVPLLNGQPVDVLRRAQGGATLGACEQWQQGEVVTSTGRLTSYGGDRPVTVRVTSAGEAVLGVTYPPPHVPGVAPPVPAIVAPSASSSSSSSREDGPTTTTKDGSSSSAAEVEPGSLPPLSSASASSSKPPLHGSGGPPLPPAQSPTPAILLAEPYLLAPRSTFAVRVPTLAHITPVQAGSTPAPSVRSMDKRAKSLLSECASVTARLHVCGRAGLADYCLLDVLPPDTAPFSTRSAAAGAETADSSSPYAGPQLSPGHGHHVWHVDSPLEVGLRQAYGHTLGHVSSGPRGRSASDATQEQLEQITGLVREASVASVSGSRSRRGSVSTGAGSESARREHAHTQGAAGTDTLTLPYSRAFAFYGETNSSRSTMSSQGKDSSSASSSGGGLWKSSQPSSASSTAGASRAGGPGEPGLAGQGHLPARLTTRPWRLARLHWEPVGASFASASAGGGGGGGGSSAGGAAMATRARTGSGSLGVGINLGMGSSKPGAGQDRAIVADFATEAKKGSSSASASPAPPGPGTTAAAAAAGGGGSATASAVGGAAGQDTTSSATSAVTHRPIVHWFEPMWVSTSDDTSASSASASASASASPMGGRKLVPILRAAPLEDMLACAAPGTHTVPFVPGLRLETRRLGGLWAPSRVEWADRGLIAVSVMRPALRCGHGAPHVRNGSHNSSSAAHAVIDSNASLPLGLASFGKLARPMIVKKKRRRKGAAAAAQVAVPSLSRDRSSSFVPISGHGHSHLHGWMSGSGRGGRGGHGAGAAGAAGRHGGRSALERWAIVKSRLQGVSVGSRLSRWGSAWGRALLAPFAQPHSLPLGGAAAAAAAGAGAGAGADKAKGTATAPAQNGKAAHINGSNGTPSTSSSTGLVDSVELIPQHMWCHLLACKGQYVGEEGWKAFDTLFRQQRMKRAQAGRGGGTGAGSAIATAAASLLADLSSGQGAAVSAACASVHEDLQAKQGALMRLVRPE